jgi:uncharacterized protein (DUF2141 family)
MKFLLTGLSLLLLFTTTQARPQANTVRLDVQVTHVKSTEGVPEALITLQGPYSASSTSLYTPSSALTPDMREQIDILFKSAPIGISGAIVIDAARRMEAQFMGLPPPSLTSVTTPGPSAEPPVPQVTGKTDASGHVVFENLSPGRYRVRAQHDGYFGPPPLGNTLGAPPTTTTTLTIDAPQSKPAEVHLNLVQGSTLSGRVRSPEGKALVGAEVYAYQITYPNGRVALNSVNSKTTDDRGEYRLFYLPPGEYLIGATLRRVSNTPSPQDSYARTFYPGIADGNAATRVKVAEGNDVTGIDIDMRAGASGTVSGRLVTSFTQPANFFLVPQGGGTLFDPATMNYQNQSSNRTNGEFELRGMFPGSYELIATIPGLNGVQVQAMGRTRVQVPDVGIAGNVVVTLKPPQQLKLHPILDAGALGAPGTTPPVRLFPRSLEVYSAPFDANAVTYSIDASGDFVFPNIMEGRYTVSSSALPANSYISDIRMAGRSVFDDGFAVGEVPEAIEVRIGSKSARVQGTVLDFLRKPATTARIVLVPERSRRQNQLLYKTAISDSKGAFTITGVAPGQYKLFAWESVPGTAYMSAEFMAPYEMYGQAITITEGSVANTELKLIK